MQVKCRNKVFEVYEVSEAEENGLQFTKDWRNASKNDWIVTADNKVIQVIGRRDYKKKRRFT